MERAFSQVAASNVLKEVIVSITTLGSAAGGFLGGFASDYVGRRMTILASDVIFILGAVLLGTASTSVQLIVGRTVIGFAIGVASIVVPVYIAEVSPKSIRAMLVVLFSLQIGVGLCLAFIGGFALSASSSAAAWRIILALPAIAAVLQLAAMAFLPESPRWLAHSGRIAEAEAVMRTLTAAPGASSALGGTPTVSAADAAAEEEITMELREVYREGKFLRTPDGQTEAWNLRPRPVATQLALGVGLSCLHSLAGARTIMYYSLEIISMAGFITELALMQAIFTMGSFGTIGLVIGFFLIDRVGRRVLAIVSGVGTSLCLFMLAASFSLSATHSPSSAYLPGVADQCSADPASGVPITTCQTCLAAGCGYCSLPPGVPGQYHTFPGHCFAGVVTGNFTGLDACSSLGAPDMRMYVSGCPSGFGWMSMAALCLFQTFFQLGLGLIPAVINAEYYPARVRGLCNGIAVSSNWLSNFFISGTFLTLVDLFGTPGTFALYGSLVAIGTVGIAVALPETSGLSFSEIQGMFELYGQPNAPPPWRLHEWAPRHVRSGTAGAGAAAGAQPPPGGSEGEGGGPGRAHTGGAGAGASLGMGPLKAPHGVGITPCHRCGSVTCDGRCGKL